MDTTKVNLKAAQSNIPSLPNNELFLVEYQHIPMNSVYYFDSIDDIVEESEDNMCIDQDTLNHPVRCLNIAHHKTCPHILAFERARRF